MQRLKALLLPIRALWWTITLQLGRRLRFRRDYRLIAHSGIFDAAFYLRQCGGSATGIDPLRHFLIRGGLEGCDPHPLFDSDWYLQQNPEVEAAGSNPLVHYLRQGWRQKRNPHPLFDTGFYLDRNSDIAQTGVEPLYHYIANGNSEGRDPHPLFDNRWYLGLYPDAVPADGTALSHYLLSKKAELRRPHPLFEPKFYVARHPDAGASGMHALLHYVTTGAKQRYSPHPLFDIDFYVRQSPNLANSGADLLRHYICEGARSGLDPCELFDSSFYLESYPEVARKELNPLAHYWTEGIAERCNPNPLFDTEFYLKQYPGIAADGMNPLVDFIECGARRGRLPNPFFDPLFYLETNPDVRRAGINPLAHYLKRGAAEGRDPSPFFSTKGYVSAHRELKDSGVNPLAHFLACSKGSDHVPLKTVCVAKFREPNSSKARCGQLIDLLWDLTGFQENLVNIRDLGNQLFSCDRLGGMVAGATVLLPASTPESVIKDLPNWRFAAAENSILAANEAIEGASAAGSHLLVLFGPVLPDKPAAERLIKAFDIDPHFGIAIPRQYDTKTKDVLALSDNPVSSTLPQQFLSRLPEYYILPEILSSCFLLGELLVSNFEPLSDCYQTLAGAFQEYLCRARRCGFRSVVVNSADISASEDTPTPLISVTRADLYRVHTEHADIGRAKAEFSGHALHLHERLLKASLGRRLLLDARGIQSQMDGTAEAVLGLCDGLAQLDHKWRVTLLAEPDPAKFHRLPERYSGWEVIDELAGPCFTAAFRPSQPWDIHSMVDLHRAALFNFYTMLDTIAWDILFVAPRGLDTLWNFLSAHVDGILYISRYTRDRFATRFPLSRKTPGFVSYLSFDPDDYKIDTLEKGATQGDFILVAGNGYDHKNVGPTVDLLASAFPFQRIKALGLASHESSLVEPLASGRIPQNELDRLFAEAKAIVFPSFYEGFGFPVLKGLSNGRIVIARHSELLLEVASRYRGPGRLVAFRNRRELVDAIGRVLHNQELDEVALGTGAAEGLPRGWRAIAAGVIEFIEERIDKAEQRRWLDRQDAITQMKRCL